MISQIKAPTIFALQQDMAYEHYHLWYRSVRACAGSMVLTGSPQGLLSYGAHLRTQEYAPALAAVDANADTQRDAVEAAFDAHILTIAPAPAPNGAMPALIMAPPPYTALVATDTAAVKEMSKAKNHLALEYRLASSALVTSMVESLSPLLQKVMVAAFDTGVESLGPNRIIEFILTRFAQMPIATVAKIHRRFDVPLSAINRFEATAMAWSDWQESLAKSALPSALLCEKLTVACQSFPILIPMFARFNRDHPVAAVQDFSTLVKSILTELSLNHVNYAQDLSAVIPNDLVTPPPAVTQTVAAVTTAPAVKKKKHPLTPAAYAAGVVAAPAPAQPRQKAYCWYHGLGGHDGRSCNAMKDQADGWTDAHRNATSNITIGGQVGAK